MGLFDKLFKKEQLSRVLTNLPRVQEKTVSTEKREQFYINPDIEDLLWIADGPKRNYKGIPQKQFTAGGFTFSISFSTDEEPSLIYTKLPVKGNVDISKVERPSYFPTYKGLTEEQKRVYWRLLENPYNSDINIGYVFILYYGLERYLLSEKFENAFDVILKLRDSHSNASFQSYSANALILTALCRNRTDLIAKFISSLDNDYELVFSDDLYLLCKFGLKLPLTSNEIMRFARTFEFTKTNYIKNYPEIFIEELNKLIFEKWHKTDLLISDFIKSADSKSFRKEKVPVFANTSIMDREMEIPLISEHFKFKKAMYDLLDETHEQVKSKLVELRKSGKIQPVKTAKTTEKVIITFDINKEKALLNQLKNHKRILDKHFDLIEIQDFYYKYRKLDQKYLEKCIEYCKRDIEMLDKIQESYLQETKKEILALSGVYNKAEINQQISEIQPFEGRIPTFTRLAIIYEKEKSYEKALDIYDIALEYYENCSQSNYQAIAERKAKLMAKLDKKS